MKIPFGALLLAPVFALFLTGCVPEQKDPPLAIALEIAEANGLAAWDQISELRYTFHVILAEDKPEIQRSWIWKPQIGEVTMQKPGEEPITWLRSELEGASEEVLKADAAFINDEYWLVFPLHLVWDQGTTISVEDGKSPIDGMDARIVSVQYGAEGGYTPGDLYKLSVNEDGRVFEWAYHPKGQEEAARATRWVDYEEKGGLPISMNRTSDSAFRIWFSGVEVLTE